MHNHSETVGKRIKQENPLGTFKTRIKQKNPLGTSKNRFSPQGVIQKLCKTTSERNRRSSRWLHSCRRIHSVTTGYTHFYMKLPAGYTHFCAVYTHILAGYTQFQPDTLRRPECTCRRIHSLLFFFRIIAPVRTRAALRVFGRPDTLTSEVQGSHCGGKEYMAI